MDKRTHHRTRSGTSKKISGTSTGRKLGYNVVTHNKFSKTNKPKIIIKNIEKTSFTKKEKKQLKSARELFLSSMKYKEVTITSEDIKMMQSFQSDVEFSGALDYDGHHPRPSETYVERGFDTSVNLLKAYSDPDYEILFHTHPDKAKYHHGPSGADIENMIWRTKQQGSKQQFVIDANYVYGYEITDMEKIDELIIEMTDEKLEGEIKLKEVYAGIIDQVAITLAKLSIKNNKAIHYYETKLINKNKNELTKKEKLMMENLTKEYFKIEKRELDDFEKYYGIKIINYGKNPKQIKTEIPIVHEPLKDNRSNPHSRVKKLET